MFLTGLFNNVINLILLTDNINTINNQSFLCECKQFRIYLQNKILLRSKISKQKVSTAYDKTLNVHLCSYSYIYCLID